MAAPSPAGIKPAPLALSPIEKSILWDLYRGCGMDDIARRLDCSTCAAHGRLTRCRVREGCDSTMRLMIRFIEEYLGVLDPWPGFFDGPK